MKTGLATLSIIAVLAAVVMMSLGRAPQGAPSRHLTITGSSTIAPVMREIGRRFEARHPGVRIDVETGGSSRGIRDARSGLADIGMVSRSRRQGEEDLHWFARAKDGVCLIVHRDNPVRELTGEQIVAIYTKQITNWKELGGRDAPITVVSKADGRSTLEVFLAYFKLKNSDVRADVIVGDNQHGIKMVAGVKNAIGYVSVGTAEYEETHGVAIKLLRFEGTTASVENVRNGSFPIARTLNVVTRNEPLGLTAEFLEFSQSKEARDIFEDQYFVPVEK